MKFLTAFCFCLLTLASCTSVKLTPEQLEKGNYKEVSGMLDISEDQERPDKLPMYPGGTHGFSQAVRNQLVYPQEAKDKNIDGVAIVKFLVKKDGSIAKPAIDRSVHPLLDEQALAAVTKVGDFHPAMKDGKPFPIYLKTLVVFRNFQPTEARKANQ